MNNCINVAYLSFKGQSKLTISRQKEAEDFMKKYDIDILHCQEIQIDDKTFNQWNYI